MNCFHTLAIVNIVDMNDEEWVSLHIPYVISFGCTPRIGIAGSCASSLVLFFFFFWRIVAVALIVTPDEHYMKVQINIPLVSCLYLWVCFCFVYVLNVTCKWHYTVLVFVWLISIGIICFRSIHIVANGRILFFLMLNNVPLHIHVIASLSIYLLMDICVSSTSWLL